MGMLPSIDQSQTVLILAPHTDDGEFGCGGTIAKFAESGARVIYAAFSAAEQSVLPHLPRNILRQEVKAATLLLGIKEEDCLIYDFPVRRFQEHRQAILDAMIDLQKRYKPKMVFLPSTADTHQDHFVVSQEGFRAFKKTTLLGYEVPWNNLTFQTNAFVSLSEENLEKKARSLKCYESQAHRSYASENFIRSLAVVRGTQIDRAYAEAFEVSRWVID